MKSSKPYRYEEACKLVETIMGDLAMLSGDAPGNSATWQDIAGTLAVNLEVLAGRITAAREGRVVGGPVVFPSPSECLDKAMNDAIASAMKAFGSEETSK